MISGNKHARMRMSLRVLENLLKSMPNAPQDIKVLMVGQPRHMIFNAFEIFFESESNPPRGELEAMFEIDPVDWVRGKKSRPPNTRSE